MKLEQTTVAIEPRSLGACVDLALVFLRHHLRPLLALTLLFAVPATVLSAVYARAFAGGGWLAALLTYFAAAPFLGAVLVSGAGRAVFGDPFTAGGALKGLHGAWWPLIGGLIGNRALVAATALPCLGLVGGFIDVYYGFLSEVLVLEGLRGAAARRRCRDLVSPTFIHLAGRKCALLFVTITIAAAFVSLVDQGAALLLGRAVVSGRIESRFFMESIEWILVDPLSLALATSGLWLAYPLARLAWFFSYLDVRIGREGWDLELAFRIEARRLEPTA